MRRTLIVLLLVTIAIMLVMAAPAFAKTGTKSGGYWPYSGAIATEAMPAGDPSYDGIAASLHGHAYVFADSATSPHAGYSSATGKCKVCHAVHGAGMTKTDKTSMLGSEKLLRGTAADACTFCHLGDGAFATDPYTGGPHNSLWNYNGNENGGDYAWGGVDVARSGHFRTHGHDNPQGSGVVKSYQGCTSCHAVHGAKTITSGALKPNILKNDPAKGVTSAQGWKLVTSGTPAVTSIVVDGTGTGFGSIEAPVTTQTQFCEDCHDGTKLVPTSGTPKAIVAQADFNTAFSSCGWRNDRASTDATGLCHNSVTTAYDEAVSQFGAFNAQTHNMRSHIMTASSRFNDTALAPGGDPATKASNSCVTCHDVRNFPHFGVDDNGTTLNNQMVTGFAHVQESDQPCMKCHGTVGTDY